MSGFSDKSLPAACIAALLKTDVKRLFLFQNRDSGNAVSLFFLCGSHRLRQKCRKPNGSPFKVSYGELNPAAKLSFYRTLPPQHKTAVLAQRAIPICFEEAWDNNDGLFYKL